MADKKTKVKIKVKALPAFLVRRYSTLPAGLVTREEFRELKAGGKIEIEKKDLKNLLVEAKNGNS